MKFTGVDKWLSDKLVARLEMLNIAQQFVLYYLHSAFYNVLQNSLQHYNVFFTLFVFFNKLEQFISLLVADISKTDLRRRARLWKRLLQEKQEKLRLSGSTHTCLASARWSLHTCLSETKNFIY